MWNGLIIAVIVLSTITGISTLFIPEFMMKRENKNAMKMAE